MNSGAGGTIKKKIVMSAATDAIKGIRSALYMMLRLRFLEKGISGKSFCMDRFL